MHHLFRGGWILVILTLFLAGCGGSDHPRVRTTPLYFSVSWAERTRSPLYAPASALSLVLTLAQALPDGADLVVPINRRNEPPAYTNTYTSAPQRIRPGAYTLSMVFYAGPNGTGDLVAEIAGAAVTIDANGGGIGTLMLTSRIDHVVVLPEQHLSQGETKTLDAAAYSADNQLIAITPGSFTWSTAAATDVLQFIDHQAQGLAVGEAQVTAAVDGVTSPAATVTVTAGQPPATTLRRYQVGDYWEYTFTEDFSSTYGNTWSDLGTLAVAVTQQTYHEQSVLGLSRQFDYVYYAPFESIDYVTQDAGSGDIMLLGQWWNDQGTDTIVDRQLIAPVAILPGTWSDSYAVNTSLNFQNGDTNILQQSTKDTATVTVPAGTFACWLLNSDNTNEPQAVMRRFDWFSPTLGAVVKSTVIYTYPNGSVDTYHFTLTAYNLVDGEAAP